MCVREAKTGLPPRVTSLLTARGGSAKLEPSAQQLWQGGNSSRRLLLSCSVCALLRSIWWVSVKWGAGGLEAPLV